MARKQNASTVRTRALLHDAVLRLLEEHDAHTITVNQIAATAGLNRTTFYLHYPDSGSLMEAAFDELLEKMNEGGRQLLHWDATSLQHWEETFYRTLAERPKLFARSLAAGNSDPLGRRFLEAVTRSMHDVLATNEAAQSFDPHYREMLAHFATSGIVGMSVAWLEAGMPVDATRICRWTWAFFTQLIEMPEPPEATMRDYLSHR
jgi:AcrR family transcriptional regulator